MTDTPLQTSAVRIFLLLRRSLWIVTAITVAGLVAEFFPVAVNRRGDQDWKLLAGLTFVTIIPVLIVYRVVVRAEGAISKNPNSRWRYKFYSFIFLFWGVIEIAALTFTIIQLGPP